MLYQDVAVRNAVVASPQANARIKAYMSLLVKREANRNMTVPSKAEGREVAKKVITVRAIPW